MITLKNKFWFFFWPHHRESNPELLLRRELLYPFNYGEDIKLYSSQLIFINLHTALLTYTI